MSLTKKESTVAEIDAFKNNELDLTKVDFSQVDQPGSVGLYGHLKGFWITFSTIFKKPETVEYPEVKAPTQERFHGRHQLNRHPDGLVKCIGACPTRALTMTNEYELADDSRAKLIFEKEDLLGPLRAGMLMPPHPMYPDMTDTNYYKGDVTQAHPSQDVNK